MMTGFSTSCGACKFLRRKCMSGCVFAPYFRYEQAPQHFAAVHRVFGASNASRILLRLPEQCRSEAATAMSFEALARIQDPVYGCVAYVYALQQQIAELREEVEALSNHMAANLATSFPSSGLELPTQSSFTELQEYTTEQENWPEYLMNNANRVSENQISLLSQLAYAHEKDLFCVSEPSLLKTHQGGMIINEDLSNHLPWLPNNT